VSEKKREQGSKRQRLTLAPSLVSWKRPLQKARWTTFVGNSLASSTPSSDVNENVVIPGEQVRTKYTKAVGERTWQNPTARSRDEQGEGTPTTP
jgi:hypothetical protein